MYVIRIYLNKLFKFYEISNIIIFFNSDEITIIVQISGFVYKCLIQKIYIYNCNLTLQSANYHFARCTI